MLRNQRQVPTPTQGPPAILPSAFSPPGYSSTVQKLFPCVPWVLGPAEPPLPGVQGRAGRAAGVRGLQPPRPRPPPSAAAADEPVGKAAHEDKRRPTGPVAEQTAAGLAGYCSRWNVSGSPPGELGRGSSMSFQNLKGRPSFGPVGKGVGKAMVWAPGVALCTSAPRGSPVLVLHWHPAGWEPWAASWGRTGVRLSRKPLRARRGAAELLRPRTHTPVLMSPSAQPRF